jgi:hypothetical protein
MLEAAEAGTALTCGLVEAEAVVVLDAGAAPCTALRLPDHVE